VPLWQQLHFGLRYIIHPESIDVNKFLKDNIPAFKKMKSRTRQGLINDWVNFIAPPPTPPPTLKESKSPLTRERERVRRRLSRWRRGVF